MEETLKEVWEKCKESPYYFATNFIKVRGPKGDLLSFTTSMTEEEFNSYFIVIKKRHGRYN